MRLTFWNDRKGHFDWHCENNEIADKLAAYEDTGYSPLEIKSLEGEWNAMRKVVDSYRKAEEQGRFVMMYNELVEALRLCVKYGKAEDALANAQKAADAIEKLSQIVREYQKFDGFLAAHGMFKQDPMVPLPEPPKEEV